MRSLLPLALGAIGLGAILLFVLSRGAAPAGERSTRSVGATGAESGSPVLEALDREEREPLPLPPVTDRRADVSPGESPRASEVPVRASGGAEAGTGGPRLVGRVTRDEIGVDGAVVTARMDFAHSALALGSTTAGADGEYTLPLPALGAMSEVDSAIGVVRVRAQASGAGVGREEAPWSEAVDSVLRVDLELELETLLVGRVVDSEGEPVAAATLVLEWREGERELEREHRLADPLGTFEIEVEEPGEQRLHVHAPSAGRMSISVADVALGDVVDLGDLELEPSGTLEGRVVATDGTPIPGCWIEACRTDPAGTARGVEADVWSGADGRFRFAGLEGEWWILSAGEEEQPGPLRAGSHDLELVVTRPTLSVRLVDPAGRQLRGVAIDVSADSHLAATPPSEHFHDRYLHVSYEAPDGTVHKTFYEPYPVVLYAAESIGGELWMAEQRVDVQPGHSALTMVLEPRAHGARLTVDVRGPDGELLDGCRVELVSNVTDLVWDRDVKRGERVPAGAYTVRAVPPGASYVPPFERVVDVPEVGDVAIEMRAPRAGGRVELALVGSESGPVGADSSRVPVAMAWLLPEGNDAGHPTRFLEDGGDDERLALEGLAAGGSYITAHALPAGRYRLELRGSLEAASRVVEVQQGRTTLVTLSVRPR